MLFKKYASIAGYLERESIASWGRLKVRYHKILSADGTPYLHSHPFHYLSIVLWGFYTEQVLVGDKLITRRNYPGRFIWRRAQTHHRIISAHNCRTLFFAFDSKHQWSLARHPAIAKEDFHCPSAPGVYLRIINEKQQFCRFDSFWFIGAPDIATAQRETRLSIYQVGTWASV